MKTSTKLVVAAALVAAAVWVPLASRPDSAPRAPSVAPPTAAEVAASEPVSVDVATVNAGASGDDARREAAPLAGPEAGALFRIEGRCVDSQGRPLSGIHARFQADGVDAPVVESDASGDDGRIAWSFDLPRDRAEGDVRAIGAGLLGRFVRAECVRGTTTQLGDVAFTRAGRVVGRAVDPKGRPLEGAKVVLAEAVSDFGGLEAARVVGPTPIPFVPEASSAADGSFELAGVPPGSARLWVRAAGFVPSWSEPLAVGEGATVDAGRVAVARVDESEWIQGTVLAPDGSPARGVMLAARYEFAGGSGERGIEVDESGRFRFLPAKRVAHGLRVRDPECRWSDAVVIGVEPGVRGLSIRLTDARALEIAVRTASGEPVESWRAAIEDGDPIPRSVVDTRRGAKRFVEPPRPFSITVTAEGFVPAVIGPFEPGRLASPIDVVLHRAHEIRGSVTADGRPVAGASVRLLLRASDEEREYVDGLLSRVRAGEQASVRTGADGGFALALRFRGDFVLRVEADGYAAAEVEPLSLDPGEEHAPLRVELRAGGAIAGLVEVSGGESVAGRVVLLTRLDGNARVLRTDSEGGFRAAHLMPGRWWAIVLGAGEEPPLPSSRGTRSAVELPPPTCEVQEGLTTRIVLTPQPRVSVDGSLRFDGAPAAAWRASLRKLQQFDLHFTDRALESVDSEGRFRVRGGAPGKYALNLVTPGDGGESLRVYGQLDLPAGTTRWSSDLVTGRVEGTAPEALRGPGALRARVRLDGGIEAWVDEIRFDASGAFVIPRVPQGRLELLKFGRSGDALAAVDVVAGATVRVDVE